MSGPIDAAYLAFAQQRYADAAAINREILKSTPGDPGALLLAARLCLVSQQPDVAERILRALVGQYPSEQEPFLDLAQALSDQAKHDEAIGVLRGLVNAAPAYLPGLLRLAHLLMSMGRSNDAQPIIEAALRLNPKSIDAVIAQLRAHSAQPHDAATANAIALANDPAIDNAGRARLHYALLQVFKGDPAAFLRHFQSAQDLRGGVSARAREAYGAMNSALDAALSAIDYKRAPRAQEGAPTPIFILGMPRSGTTLIERLLSAHPDVAAGGELDYMRGPLTWAHGAMTGATFPAALMGLTSQQLDALAGPYTRRLSLLARGRRFVTDKTPSNYNLLGPLALLFPGARFIHARRDPMDTCFSILQYPFEDRSAHTFDQVLLAQQYRHYQRLMARWERDLPGRFLTVDYERLVEAPDREAERLFEHCGLSWNPLFLEPPTTMAVRTFSADQVRKPIYRTSVGGWRPFADALRTLELGLSAEP